MDAGDRFTGVEGDLCSGCRKGVGKLCPNQKQKLLLYTLGHFLL